MPEPRSTRTRHLLVVALTFVTGTADAVGFFALGGAFSSVMTGNMVLLGLAGSQGDLALASHVGIAIACFIIGVVLGAWISGTARDDDPIWPKRVTVALVVEAVLMIAFLIVWEVTLADQSAAVQQVLLGISAGALGIQSSAVQRFGVRNLSSTYLTGTLTTTVSGFAAGKPFREQLPSLSILLFLILGAAGGGLMVATVSWLAPLLILVPLLGVIITASIVFRAKKPARELSWT